MTNAVNLASAAGTGFFRNKLINGAMEVAQRGANFTNPLNVYTLDRWFTGCTNCNIAQVNFGPNKALSFNYTSATNTSFIDQPLESATVKQIVGKTVTFSFNAASSTGTPTINIAIYKNSTADIRTGGSWSVISSTSVTLSTTYTRYSITATIPADGTANGVLVQVSAAANQPNASAIYVSQFQLEEGSVATPFEHRPYGLEFSLCERYYQRLYVVTYQYVPGAATVYAPLAYTTMRTTPTASVITANLYSGTTSVSVSGTGPSGGYVAPVGTSAGYIGAYPLVALGAEL